MDKKDKVLFTVADALTPKVDNGEVAFSLLGRDHKNPPVMVLNDQGGSVMGVSENVSGTLRSEEHGHQPIVFEPGAASRVGGHVYDDDVAGTVRANAGDNQQAIAYTTQACGDRDKPSQSYMEEKAYTIPSNPMSDRGQAVVYGISSYESAVATEPPLIEMTSTKNTVIQDGICPTLTGRMGTGGNQVNSVLQQTENPKAVDCRNLYENDVSATLQTKENGGHSLNYQNPVRTSTVVRRLTPLECERLQGFPDGWTDIGEWEDSKGKKRKCTDGARYKALGNSIALPFWQWMAHRIVAQYDRPVTMASLFDGIGGFPLVFLRSGCKPIWASEIEDFCVAVTKLRFKEDSE